MNLRTWQLNRLEELADARFETSRHAGEVTIVVYTFPPKGREDEMFQWIKCSILHTWALLGKIKTVIVAHACFPAVRDFAARHEESIDLQISPDLVPGNIKTMSLDCIKNLHARFETPYCLIIQDDGFPLRGNLGDFLGKYDYLGAPIISDGWKRKLAYSIGMGSFNGGFSLRSKRFCEHAAGKWRSLFTKIYSLESIPGEDYYYTTILKILPSTWLHFRYPCEKTAAAFALDGLSGYHAIPPDAKPFGFHGAYAFERLYVD